MSLLIPERIVESFREVTPALCRAMGASAVVVDIDNTLVAPREARAGQEVLDWAKGLCDAGLRIALVSNNTRERVKIFNDGLNLASRGRAMKPLRRSFSWAAKVLGVPRGEVLVVGDQIFTDVAGAHLSGMKAVLVEPIELKENLGFRIKRALERPFVRRYYRQHPKG